MRARFRPASLHLQITQTVERRSRTHRPHLFSRGTTRYRELLTLALPSPPTHAFYGHAPSSHFLTTPTLDYNLPILFPRPPSPLLLRCLSPAAALAILSFSASAQKPPPAPVGRILLL